MSRERKNPRLHTDRWFDYSLDVDARKIYLGNVTVDSAGTEMGVDSAMAERVIKGLHILQKKGDEPIQMLMNNPGGNVMDGYAIFDAIASSEAPVDITVYGQASSIGSIILQAGRLRLLQPNTIMMIHEGYSKDVERLTMRSYENWGEWSRGDRKKMYELFATRSGKPVEYWKEVCSHDTIFTAQKAVKVGLADKVLSYAPWYKKIIGINNLLKIPPK